MTYLLQIIAFDITVLLYNTYSEVKYMKVDKKTLEYISKWFKASGLSSATIEISSEGNFKVTMNKESPKNDYAHYHIASGVPHLDSHPQSMVSSSPVSMSTVENEVSQQNTTTETKQNNQQISSPIVGTFYRSVSPDTPPFVQEGDKVKKGDVLCIIEAMKVMNEFEAEYDMEIVSVLVENSQLVEYGQSLFEVRSL